MSTAHGLGFWTDRSAVHEAAAHGRALQLKQLIEEGAAVNIVAVNSITPLHEACIHGQTQCVRLLLDAGAQVSCFVVRIKPSWWRSSLGSDHRAGDCVASQWLCPTGGCT